MLSHVWILPALAGLTLFGAAIESIRLGLLFASQGVHLSFRQGYRLVSVGTFFNFCFPGGTGGDVVKLYYLTSENRGRGIEVAMVLLIDRVVALFSLLGLAIGVAVLDGHLMREYALIRWLVTASAVGMVGLVLVAMASCSTTIRANRTYLRLIHTLPFHHYLERASDALYAFRDHKRAVILAALASLVGHLALAAMFLSTGTVLVPHATGLVTPVLALFGMLANALPITPGGLGVGEVAFNRLFNMAGLTGGAPLLLAWRAGMLPLCVIGCLIYVMGVKSRLQLTTRAGGPSVGSSERASDQVAGVMPSR